MIREYGNSRMNIQLLSKVGTNEESVTQIPAEILTNIQLIFRNMQYKYVTGI